MFAGLLVFFIVPWCCQQQLRIPDEFFDRYFWMINFDVFPQWPRKLAKRLNLSGRWNAFVFSKQRVSTEKMLAEFSCHSEGQNNFHTVMVDGSWDNPNYWARYALVRRALGLSQAHEVGLVGPFNVKKCSQTFKRLSINNILTFNVTEKAQRYKALAHALLSKTKTPEDILTWQLPHGFPGDFLYDGILKRLRAPCIDLADPRLPGYIAEALGSLEAAETVLNMHDFKLVVLSHALNFQYAGLAWIALRQGIPVLVVYGEFGVSRFVKINRQEEMWETTNRPTTSDFESMPRERADALAQAGKAYIEKRLHGNTEDLAALYSYKKRKCNISRAELCREFEWDFKRPIIAVYASNWFDYPHTYGMSHFQDFLDWINSTLGVAKRNRSVNWLFKAHPCDEWYGGKTLSDFMPTDLGQHIRQASREWNGAAMMDIVDGLVTYHGTAGVEFAAIGKPVLLADKGWYHELGVARWSRSREEYLRMLSSEWWKDLDLVETTRRACMLAGWHFCRPSWQGSFVFEDDPVQHPIYETLPVLWTKHSDIIRKELKTLREWFESSHRHYHTYKMTLSKDFLF